MNNPLEREGYIERLANQQCKIDHSHKALDACLDRIKHEPLDDSPYQRLGLELLTALEWDLVELGKLLGRSDAE